MKWNKEKSNIIVTGSAANPQTMVPNVANAVTTWHINIKTHPQCAGDLIFDINISPMDGDFAILNNGFFTRMVFIAFLSLNYFCLQQMKILHDRPTRISFFFFWKSAAQLLFRVSFSQEAFVWAVPCEQKIKCWMLLLGRRHFLIHSVLLEIKFLCFGNRLPGIGSVCPQFFIALFDYLCFPEIM